MKKYRWGLPRKNKPAAATPLISEPNEWSSEVNVPQVSAPSLHQPGPPINHPTFPNDNDTASAEKRPKRAYGSISLIPSPDGEASADDEQYYRVRYTTPPPDSRRRTETVYGSMEDAELALEKHREDAEVVLRKYRQEHRFQTQAHAGGDMPASRFVCPHCARIFGTVHGRARHTGMAHPVGTDEARKILTLWQEGWSLRDLGDEMARGVQRIATVLNVQVEGLDESAGPVMGRRYESRNKSGNYRGIRAIPKPLGVAVDSDPQPVDESPPRCPIHDVPYKLQTHPVSGKTKYAHRHTYERDGVEQTGWCIQDTATELTVNSEEEEPMPSYLEKSNEPNADTPESTMRQFVTAFEDRILELRAEVDNLRTELGWANSELRHLRTKNVEPDLRAVTDSSILTGGTP